MSSIGLEQIVFMDTYSDMDRNTIIFDVRLNVRYKLKIQLKKNEIKQEYLITFFMF